MSDISSLLVSLSSLIWPTIILILILKFTGPIKELLAAAKTRGFTIKLAGSELTFTEVSEQQRSQISDLQEQVVRLMKEVESIRNSITEDTQNAEEQPEQDVDDAERHPRALRRVLWVDDYPGNNASIVAHLASLGIQIDTALSTREGLDRFHQAHYDVIISDMGRHEDGAENPDAGIDLTKAIRDYNTQIPVLIFCSKIAMKRYEKEALNEGATAVTSSAVRLLNELSRVGSIPAAV